MNRGRGRPTKTFDDWGKTYLSLLKARNVKGMKALAKSIATAQGISEDQKNRLIEGISIGIGRPDIYEKFHIKVTNVQPEITDKQLYEEGLLDWVTGDDTGTSSKTLFIALVGAYGRDNSCRIDVPHDIQDFGRCYRFLALLSKERKAAALERVAKRFPKWRPIVSMWSELERLYEENSDKFYDVLDGLNNVGEILKKMQTEA